MTGTGKAENIYSERVFRLLTLMRHLLLIGGGPIGVASAYIKRFSNHPNQAQPTQE